jgi:hypothetical protein
LLLFRGLQFIIIINLSAVMNSVGRWAEGHPLPRRLLRNSVVTATNCCPVHAPLCSLLRVVSSNDWHKTILLALRHRQRLWLRVSCI